MSLRAKIYKRLNELCGNPVKLVEGVYPRTDQIFHAHTTKLLSSIEPRIEASHRILIVGCGTGQEIEWFAKRAGSVVAIDTDVDAIAASLKVAASLPNVECREIDGKTLPFAANEFDRIFMHNVCEHIIHLNENFAEFFRVLKRGGLVFNQFAPLFYSPFGAHLQDALTLPWGHLIFGFRPVLELRNMYYPRVDTSKDWAEFGLNRLTERRYRRIIARSGFASEHYEVRNSKGISIFNGIPLVRNLFILQIYNILRKPA